LGEILRAEGVLGWEECEVAEAAGAGIAVLPACRLEAEARAELAYFVAEGGTLIASRPPAEMAELFGLRWTGRVLRDGYLRLAEDDWTPAEIAGMTLQCPGAMDLYEAAGCEVIAWYRDPLEGDARYPAVVRHSHGRGTAIAFTFDVADATVRLRQGLPAQASDGTEADPCGMKWVKPNDLFVSFLDARQRLIPQADVYHRLLVGLLEAAAAEREHPLLRLWPFPQAAPAIAMLTGDSDAMEPAHFEQVLSIIERYGGRYALYLLEEHREMISPEDAARLRKTGHGLGHHTWAGQSPTAEEMRATARRQFDGFRDRYGVQPLSHRGHSCIWVGWVEQAKILAENGVRLDGNHYAYLHHQYGFLSGSGRAFRFADEQGEPVDLWEQPTLMSDDCMLQDKTALPPFTMDETIAHSRELIDALADRWHGVYHPCFHPVYMRTDGRYPYTAPWLEAVAAHCEERGVPMLNAEAWTEFLLARRAVRLVSRQATPEGELCVLRSEVPVPGVSLLVPDGVAEVTIDGAAVQRETRRLEGRERGVVTWEMPGEREITMVLRRGRTARSPGARGTGN